MEKFKNYIGFFLSLLVLLLLQPVDPPYEERIKVSYFDDLLIVRLVSSKDVGFDILNANFKYKKCLTSLEAVSNSEKTLAYEKIAVQILKTEPVQAPTCLINFKIWPDSLFELAKSSEPLQFYLGSGKIRSGEAEKLIIDLTREYGVANEKIVKMKMELSVLATVCIFLIFLKFRSILGGMTVNIIKGFIFFLLRVGALLLKGIHRRI